MTWREIAAEQIRRHEGCHAAPYPDTEGKITIGIGRCLTTKPLNHLAIEFLFDQDLADAEYDARRVITDACFDALSDARKAVMVNMAFNLGAVGLQAFVKFLAAVKSGDYTEAAKQMLSSKWAKQVKGRATELAVQMERG